MLISFASRNWMNMIVFIKVKWRAVAIQAFKEMEGTVKDAAFFTRMAELIMKEEVEYNDLTKYVENNTVSNNSYLFLHIKDAADKLCEDLSQKVMEMIKVIQMIHT